MTPLIYLNRKQIKAHVFFWLLCIIFLNLYSSVPGSWAAKIIGNALEDLNYIFVFYYISLFVFPIFWEWKSFYLISSIFFGFILYSLITYINYFIFIPHLGGWVFYQTRPISKLIGDNILYYFIVSLAGSASFFYRNSFFKFKLQAEKEKSLLIKELNFLKNQFNSHISFNFLNYCYSKIHQYSIEVSQSIVYYSDILRYNLAIRDAKKESLEDEVAYLENFIGLQKLLNPNIQITINYNGEFKNLYIHPRILITFFDNVFKKGMINTPYFLSEITIIVEGHTLFFFIETKVNIPIKREEYVAELNNLVQILDLYYCNNYKIKIDEFDGKFKVELSINLDESISKPFLEISHGIKENTQSKSLIKKLKPLTRKQIQTHIILWLFVFAYSNITNPLHGSLSVKIIGSCLIHLNYIFVFYSLGLFVFPRFWESKRLFLVIGTLFCLIQYMVHSYLITFKAIPYLGGYTSYLKGSFWFFFHIKLYYFIIVASSGIASFFSRYSLYKLKLQKEKEKALLLKELFYFKDQFNSQITFNFLNFCYSNVNKHLPETAQSIKLFSDMLHYTLQTKPDEKVALGNEINYIKDFISLQKLLSAKVYVDFRYEGELNNKYILPRILITFVENAFKHGVSNDPNYPISINLAVDNQSLLFTVKNKINLNKATQSSHTGLENVGQILELYYTNKYELKKEEKEGVFEVELTLSL